jgi:CNT family concentrative nucleoside transporter
LTLLARLQPLVGLALILGVAYALSTNRKAIKLKVIAWGLGLQFLFAVVVLKTGVGAASFEWMGAKIQKLLGFATVGSSFVFGPLGDKTVWGDAMTRVFGPAGAQYTVLFAFQILPTIIFIAALFAILY